MRPINLLEPVNTNIAWYQISRWPLFNLGFRPLFLFTSMWACAAMLLWVALLTGNLAWQAPFPATLWHAHEMIFAFAGAVAVGFLFTAAQNWTGINTLNGLPLLLLTGVWLITRGAAFMSPWPLYSLLFGQTLFWLGAITHLTWVLHSAKSKNNYLFVVVLSALCIANLSFLILVLKQAFLLASLFTQLAVILFTVLIGIVGGRVIPFFTARGLGLSEQIRIVKTDKLLLLVSTLGVMGFVAGQIFALPVNPGYMLLLSALLHLYRTLRWFHLGVIKVPLLWSLHLGYAATALGLLAFAVSFFGFAEINKDALHLITIGGIGLMILAMMARVSLGHTSRPLHSHWLVNLGFLLCFAAALVRSLGPQVFAPHLAWLLSGALWCTAFACFIWIYFPILTQPRVDGRRG
ncbi:NnrS family protein [Pseudoalteromonas fenneropenaei]|uniref:NnrS family protein n=1 Tax=Pseudoalteromonas fenneropenaei TaxID=1737459 RepID=A0ABV7CK28_9GAMM